MANLLDFQSATAKRGVHLSVAASGRAAVVPFGAASPARDSTSPVQREATTGQPFPIAEAGFTSPVTRAAPAVTGGPRSALSPTIGVPPIDPALLRRIHDDGVRAASALYRGDYPERLQMERRGRERGHITAGVHVLAGAILAAFLIAFGLVLGGVL